MIKENYIGFYPSRPFWAISSIDFDNPDLLKSFTSLMSEEVFFYEKGSFKIKIYRDGMILFRNAHLEKLEEEGKPEPIENLVSRWGQYLDFLNCLYLFIDISTCRVQKLSYFNLHEITNRDAFRVTFEDNKWKSESIATESIASIYQMARYTSSYNPSLPIKLDHRISMRQVIEANVFEESTNLFDKIKDDLKTIKLVSNIAKSISEYKVGNYDTSLILSWFVIESIITEKWSAYIETKNIDYPGGKKRINSDRRKYFSGRDFPVSLVTNMLEMGDILQFELFEEIDKIRGYRNKIVHESENFSTEQSHCQLAIRKAIGLTLEKYNISLEPNLGYSVTGL